MKVCDLVFEIGTEEIPASYAVWALSEVKRLAEEEFKASRIPFSSMESYGTPRRWSSSSKMCPRGRKTFTRNTAAPHGIRLMTRTVTPRRRLTVLPEGKGCP